MHRTSSVFLIALLFMPALGGQNPAPAQPQPIAFTGVTIVDVAADDPVRALIANQTVLVTGSTITAIGETSRVAVPEGTQTVDAAGKFLIPGLWDMHAHLLWQDRFDYAPLLAVVNGVTGVRVTASPMPLEWIRATRTAIDRTFADYATLYSSIESRAATTYDERKAADLFARFVRNGTYHTPTLVIDRANLIEESVLAADPRLTYVRASTRERWQKELAGRMASSGGIRAWQPRVRRRHQLVVAMHRAGVQILAGTDTIGRRRVPMSCSPWRKARAGDDAMASIWMNTRFAFESTPALFHRLNGGSFGANRTGFSDLTLMSVSSMNF
jgi:hypothetical protein